jgi:hypothetical protein
MNQGRGIKRALPAGVMCAALAAIGCNAPLRREPSPAEMSDAVLLKSRPKLQSELGTMFGDNVRLLGMDVSTTPIRVGQPFKVTWYWQVEAPLAPGFQLFTQLSDGKSYRLNMDAQRLLRSVYPEARWKTGDLIKDEQAITLPSDWRSDVVVFYLGFDAPGQRLPVFGYHDAEGRAEAMRLHVVPSAGAKDASLPRLIARQASGPIVVDGQLDEADWRNAISTAAFVDAQGALASPESRARVLYDATSLYVGFAVADLDLRSTFESTDQHVGEQDAVVLSIDPSGDGKRYFELQVSPRGVRYDSLHEGTEIADWDSHAEIQVDLHGKLNDAEADGGYQVELAIPWSALGRGQPPAADTVFQVGFGVTDAHDGGAHVLSWSSERGKLLFAPP